MITEKSIDELIEDHELNIKDYNKFIKKIKTLKVKDDIDENLKGKIRRILQAVLALNYEERPTFFSLQIMLHESGQFEQQICELNKKLCEAIKERDDALNKLRAKISENETLKKIYGNLSK